MRNERNEEADKKYRRTNSDKCMQNVSTNNLPKQYDLRRRQIYITKLHHMTHTAIPLPIISVAYLTSSYDRSMINMENDTLIDIPPQQYQTYTSVPSKRMDQTCSKKTNDT